MSVSVRACLRKREREHSVSTHPTRAARALLTPYPPPPLFLVTVEQENDLLVCGDCQTSFPLHDIVQFIKHKNHACNKENVDGCATAADDDASQDDGDTPKDLSKTGRKEEAPAQAEARDVPSRDGTTATQSVEMREEAREARMPLRPKQVVDAEANTTHSGKDGLVLPQRRLATPC